MTFSAFKKDSAFKRLPRRGFKVIKPPRPRAPDETPDELDRLRRLLGDASLAKRVMTLKQRFPQGTTPELVTYDWLQTHQYQFFYQIELFGGRRKLGGVVADFLVVTSRAEGIALGVDGTWWHSIANIGLKDETYRIRIVGQLFNGYRVTQYVRMDEMDIYNKRPQVFYLALAGIEMKG